MAVENTLPVANREDNYRPAYQRLAARMGYQLPVFYFTVGNAVFPDTLHRIQPKKHREVVRRLAARYGKWPAVQNYYRQLLREAAGKPHAATARRLLMSSDPDLIAVELEQIRNLPSARPLLGAYRAMIVAPTPGRLLIPRVTWHGARNQFHQYLKAILRGDFGLSYIEGRPVASKIAEAWPGTALLNGTTLVLVYLLAVPLGMYMAQYRQRAFDRWATIISFAAYGLPAFWIATLLANFFTTPAFGMNWFPSMGFGNVPADAGWGEALRIRVAHLLLPVFCLAYPSLAYVSRHLRSAAIVEMDRPYVRTAYMKGLSDSEVLWKHIFRNAAFPLITLLGGLLPALLAGSVLIEEIFNLPGMGKLLYQSAVNEDWPVVITLVLINGVLTITGLFLADVFYALLDPRVRLGKVPPR